LMCHERMDSKPRYPVVHIARFQKNRGCSPTNIYTLFGFDQYLPTCFAKKKQQTTNPSVTGGHMASVDVRRARDGRRIWARRTICLSVGVPVYIKISYMNVYRNR
jgi:hypothetical protein